ncbi:MAG: hypothetical protein A2787_08035 [Omnitrophica WOR_2 bacterium RIFCSPHIGHO2_01_FULL_48_9]|nr:MAG: hypothetical protein A2787_08035 [Omnitrophica WOR_2 bacterium RIFCSPHIGHO2_01_FULL_48_9]
MYFIASIGLVLIFICLVVLFLLPNSGKDQKKRKAKEQEAVEQKDWEAAAHKLEWHIYSLRNDAAEFQKKEKHWEKELTAAREENKKLKDKLELEGSWHKKEQHEIDKRAKEISHLKEEIKKAEHNLGQEHSQRLRFEREFRETKQAFEAADSQRKAVELEVLGLKSQLKNLKEELTTLKRDNAELKKQKEDTTFVAKSDYDALEKQLKVKDKEFDRVVREYEKYKHDIQKEIR